MRTRMGHMSADELGISVVERQGRVQPAACAVARESEQTSAHDQGGAVGYARGSTKLGNRLRVPRLHTEVRTAEYLLQDLDRPRWVEGR
jgi:hypothetical protein